MFLKWQCDVSAALRFIQIFWWAVWGLSQVSSASRPSLDAWFGAREWAVKNEAESQGWISRQDYEEKGGEYLSEHCSSNIFIPMRISKPTARSNETSFSATEHALDVSASDTSLNTDLACEPSSGTSGVTVCE